MPLPSALWLWLVLSPCHKNIETLEISSARADHPSASAAILEGAQWTHHGVGDEEDGVDVVRNGPGEKFLFVPDESIHVDCTPQSPQHPCDIERNPRTRCATRSIVPRASTTTGARVASSSRMRTTLPCHHQWLAPKGRRGVRARRARRRR